MKDVAGDAVFHSTNQDSKLQVCFISSFFCNKTANSSF